MSTLVVVGECWANGALKYKEISNRIGPTVKHVWNADIQVLHKHNSLPLVPIQPFSASIKEAVGPLPRLDHRQMSFYYLSAHE